jgi:hypothetical protein
MPDSMANQTQLEEELEKLQKMIRVLEWDKSRQQINPAKMDKLDNLKKKEKDLVTQLDKFKV